MIDHIFRQVGSEVARLNAVLQYNEKTVTTAATLAEHMQECDQLLDWWVVQWLAELTESERSKFEALPINSNDRAAFRIIRNFARLAGRGRDFKVVAEHLAQRLPATLQTACNIRRRFCKAGILQPTSLYVPHKLAARYLWIA